MKSGMAVRIPAYSVGMDQVTRQMSARRHPVRLAARGLVGAALAVSLVACGSAGDLEILNEGPGGFTVLTGDEEVTVETEDGVVILDYGCTPGDVTVRFDAGQEVVLAGPVCSDTAIVVGDRKATLRPATD